MTPTSKAAQAMKPCAECGMPCAPGEYHPCAACLMFKACHNSETVRASLDAIKDRAVAAQPSQAQAAEAVKESPKETMERLTRQFNQMSELERAVIGDFIKRESTSPASPVASEREGDLPKLPSHIINAIIDYGNSRADRRDGEANSDLKYAIGAIRSLLATRTGSDT